MVRVYIKKRPNVSYTTTDVANAVNYVINKNGTLREAETHYGVPIAVIFHRIKGRKISIERIGAGRSTALPLETENILVQCLIARSQMGYPCDREELLNLVSDYVISNNIKTPFKGGRPGKDWYYAFMKRHPNISLKKPEHRQKVRKTARDPFIVYDFFDKLEKIMLENELNSTDRGCFVFNTDETGFNSDPSRLRAIGEKGKSLTRVSGGSGRDNTTVLATIAADGSFLPPLIIFKGAAVQARWTSDQSYPGTLYGASSNGWMEEPQFYNWFKSSFVPHVKTIRQQKKLPQQVAILLYDGHSSHMSVRIIEMAIENNIQLIRFPSHLTDKIQPLDKTVFGPMKKIWETILVNYGKSQMGKASGRLTKNKFSQLLGNCWEKGMIARNITAGFASTGIYPTNRDMFSTDLFNPLDLEKYRKTKLGTESLNTIVSVSTHTNLEKIIEPSKSGNSLETKDLVQPATSSCDPLEFSSIVGIFSKQLKKYNELDVAENCLEPKQKKVIPRLKQMKYGEILTTAEVIQKLKEAEQKRSMKFIKIKKEKKYVKEKSKKRKVKP